MGADGDNTINVYNTNPGGFAAVYGTSTHGSGVLGTSTNGAGVAAGNYFSGVALEIMAGSIRVDGAGINTNTPVFVHQVPSTNPCTYKYMTRIDNTLIDGRGSAILLVTYQDTSGLDPVRTPVGVFYDGSGAWCGKAGSWVIYNLAQSPTPSLVSGQKFNVLAVLP